jgi:hypothetical protein
MGKLIDLTGRRFGNLTVIGRAGNDHGGRPVWLCLCVCGHESIVKGQHLRERITMGCGWTVHRAEGTGKSEQEKHGAHTLP